VFAELYGTNELLSSFDSINLMAPGTDASGGWLHVDHAPLKKGCQCIQGLINMVDVGPDTTGGYTCCYDVLALSVCWQGSLLFFCLFCVSSGMPAAAYIVQRVDHAPLKKAASAYKA
jgi:hypothetical protein